MPNHFRLPDDRVEAYLREVHPGNLVTVHESGPHVTFVPFHLEQRGEQEVLVTHLVRNNPQAREPVTGPGMAVIDLTDAYISPLWYATNDELPNVPTWDYVTIHIRGPVRIDPNPEAALRAATELTMRMEGKRILDALGEQRLEMMSRAIVSVEIDVEAIEAKAKMSQNRHPDDVAGLVAHFEEHGPRDVAEYLREVSLPYAKQRFGTIETISRRHGASELG